LKFQISTDPRTQIQMHSEMLTRVRSAVHDVATYRDRLLPELQRHEALMQSMRASEPRSPETRKQIAEVAKMRQTRKKLRQQELCLKNQERRLQERISWLQTGC